MLRHTKDQGDALKTDQDADDPGDTPKPRGFPQHIIAAHLTAFGVMATRNDVAYRMRRESGPLIACIPRARGLRGL